MSGANGALQAAQEKVEQLLDAAKSGAIIPIQLPVQIEEIQHLLAQAEEEQREAQNAAAVPADMEDYIAEEAYFVGHAVHELRTPMTSIRGYTDMIGAMGELNDMQKQFLDIIKTNTRRMEGLLADVSYANKIRKGTLKVQSKMETFKNLAAKIEKDLAARAEELGRALELDIPQGLPLLNLDGELLAIALVKLVENGLQYSPAETGRVLVRAEADGNDLLIHIEDNGIGMTQEELDQLGTIYFRGERDEVREYKGSGLGIPIAFGMIEVIGGSYEVHSAVDQGTTITVRVPGMT